VAADVFGGGVNHDVGAEGERVLQVGGREGVVHHEEGPGVVRYVRERRHVGDLHERVGGRFNPDKPCFVARNSLPHRIEVGHIHGCVPDAPVAQDAVDQAVGAPVGVIAEHDVVPWPGKSPDEGVFRGKA
jgi:hypothetical protein